MISALSRLMFNLIVCYLLILVLLSYFGFTANFPQFYLYLGMTAWLIMGTLLGRYYFKDNSLLGAWTHPFSLISAPIGLGILLFAALTSIPYMSQQNSFYLMWLIAPSLLLSWIIFYVYISATKRGLPYILIILLLAHVEILLIYSGFAHLYLDGRPPQHLYFPKTNNHYILTVFTMLFAWGLSALYVSILRSFDFYQVREHTLDKLNKLDFETKKIVSIHEAGHCLCYCFFKQPPQQIKIYLFDKAMVRQDGCMGLVEAIVPKLNTKDFEEWELLALLAGQRAELSVHKKTSQGASDDVARWKAQAHTFLSKYDRKYFNQPENEAQILVNGEKEKDLFNRHTAILDEFFNKNKTLLKDLANKAFRFNPLEALHIHPYLSKAKITKNFPQEEKKGLFG